MSFIGKYTGWMLGAVAVCCTSAAVTPTPEVPPSTDKNPYSEITERNVFALKAPTPPPVEKPVEAGPPPPKIILSGITTILGHPIALMKVTLPSKPPEAGKPPPAATETSMMLSDGQRDGQIEVIQIDTAAKTVKVNNYGTEMLLSFDSNGAKSTAPVAGAAPMIPGSIPSPAGFKSSPGFPARTLRVPGPQGGNPFINPTSNPGVSTGAPAVPMASGGGFNPASQFQVAEPEKNYSPEEQIILMEAARQQAKNNKNFPPLPPTVMTSPEDTADLLRQDPSSGPPSPGQPAPVPRNRTIRSSSGPPGFP
jgi:hypothetical protein